MTRIRDPTRMATGAIADAGGGASALSAVAIGNDDRRDVRSSPRRPPWSREPAG